MKSNQKSRLEEVQSEMARREAWVGVFLKAVREEIKKLPSDKVVPLPQVLTLREAARELGIGLKALRTMIRGGAIMTITVHNRESIPVTEVQRAKQGFSPPDPADDEITQRFEYLKCSCCHGTAVAMGTAGKAPCEACFGFGQLLVRLDDDQRGVA